VNLQPGDIVLTRSRAGWLGTVIRAFTRRPSDDVYYNHVGIVVSAGDEHQAQLLEALWRVRRGPLWQLYGPPAGASRPEIGVFRLCEPLPEHRQLAAAVAETFVGRRYGWWKLGAHAVDRWLSKQAGREVFAARRLLRWDRFPICSYLVADAWAEAGVSFGPPAGAADPDHIHDYVQRPGNAELIFAGVLGEEA
jgi:hypothetical protein